MTSEEMADELLDKCWPVFNRWFRAEDEYFDDAILLKEFTTALDRRWGNGFWTGISCAIGFYIGHLISNFLFYII